MSQPHHRAVLVLDDSPQRVAAAVALLRADGAAAPVAVHQVCGSSAVAERATRSLTQILNRAERSRQTPVTQGLVSGLRYVHVLGGKRGGADRDADCCMRAASWLYDLVRQIGHDGTALDAVAGPHGPLRAALLRGALESAGTPSDRLFLYRSTAAKGRHPRSARAGKLLLIPILPPPKREYAQGSGGYPELVRRRRQEWLVGVAPEPMIVDVPAHCVRVGGAKARLTPDQLFWIAAFAGRPGVVFPYRLLGNALQVSGCSVHIASSAEKEDDEALRGWLLHLESMFVRLQPHRKDRFGRMLRNACDPVAPQLGSTLAKVSAALREVLGDAAEPYCIRARKGEGYVLDLPPRLVDVVTQGPTRSIVSMSGAPQGGGR